MKAIILAAGRGSRLKHLTAEKPKCLTEVNGKTLLSYILDALTGYFNQKDIAIIRGYSANKINVEEVIYFQNENWEQTNMLRSLMCATELLSNESCLISYSDIIYPTSTVKELAESDGDIVISYNTEWLPVWKARFENPLDDAESFKIDNQGNLLEIGKKAQTVEEIQGQYMGLLKFTPKGWQQILEVLSQFSEESIDKMDMTKLLNHLLEKQLKIQTIPIKGEWFEIDSEDDIQAYSKFLIT